MSVNPEPTLEVRKKGATHIAYEIRMCGAALYQLHNAEPNTFVAKIYLESLLLHARILREFFCDPRGKNRDDMRPGDFLGPEWTPPAHESSALDAGISKLTSKHLAHLTWKRVEAGNPQWPCVDIANDICTLARSWCEHVKAYDSQIAPEIESAVADLEVLARNYGPFMDMTYGS